METSYAGDVRNLAGEVVRHAYTVAEAVEWWRNYGRAGDYLSATGETMSEIVQAARR